MRFKTFLIYILKLWNGILAEPEELESWKTSHFDQRTDIYLCAKFQENPFLVDFWKKDQKSSKKYKFCVMRIREKWIYFSKNEYRFPGEILVRLDWKKF